MKWLSLVLVLLFSFTTCFAVLKYGDDKQAKSKKIVEQLVSTVKSILEGKDISEFRENISPEAYVINNNSYESIFEVLNSQSKKESLLLEKNVKLDLFICGCWIVKRRST